MPGPTRALIDLQALRDNLQRVKSAAPAAKVMAVIKADAYGHGMLQFSQALKAADAFAVARVGEAARLRESGCEHPIIVLSGCFNDQEWDLAATLNLQPVVHHEAQIHWLEQASPGASLTVWLKLNSGMNRLGVDPDQVEAVYSRLKAASAVSEVCWMTHFACADEPDRDVTEAQIQLFQSLTAKYSGAKSLANSAGLLAYPQAHADWVRPGIMLYGASPFVDRLGEQDDLKPVMTLRSEVASLRTVEAGAFVGYGGTWQAMKPTRVAHVGIGYGDGYPRQAKTGTPVRIGGRNCPLIGRVSMDSIAVDVSDVDAVNVGDEAILWGPDLPIEKIAERSDTISYHLLCGVTARVPRDYTDIDATGDS